MASKRVRVRPFCAATTYLLFARAPEARFDHDDRATRGEQLVPSVAMLRLAQLLALLPLVACAHSPSAAQTLPQLRSAITGQVNSPEQNAQNSTLVEQVSNDKQLHGLTRDEVSEQLGAGDPCSRHPMCGERDFEGDDWYYEIGREGGEYVRHRPALIVGFNRFGKVERTFVLRAPD